jgi:hypothetical protein
MLSTHFFPGAASLLSDSPDHRWAVAFEDEGTAGYFYARDNRLGIDDEAIVDGMLIYNVSSAPQRQMLASVQWSRDGQQAALYIDGTAQALYDFGAGRGYCRSGFPNFLDENTGGWNRSNHEWSDAVFNAFETAIFDLQSSNLPDQEKPN